MVAADSHCVEDHVRSLHLEAPVAAPAFDGAVGTQAAGVPVACRNCDEPPFGDRGRPRRVVAPAFEGSFGVHPAGVSETGRYRAELSRRNSEDSGNGHSPAMDGPVKAHTAGMVRARCYSEVFSGHSGQVGSDASPTPDFEVGTQPACVRVADRNSDERPFRCALVRSDASPALRLAIEA